MDYSNFLDVALDNFGNEFTEDEQAVLGRIDQVLVEMSGSGRAALWTDEAVCEHPKWMEVRELARQALDLLGWNRR